MTLSRTRDEVRDAGIGSRSSRLQAKASNSAVVVFLTSSHIGDKVAVSAL